MKYTKLLTISLLSAGIMVGCSNAEEFEVTGEVSSASAVAGPITLEFFEVDGEGAEAERESVKQVTLDAVGQFNETIEADPELKLVARALVDADDDGNCTAGEQWAETEITKNDDGTLAAITLALSDAACPAE